MIPKPDERNSPARWALRRAWLASHGLTPAMLAEQDTHKDKTAKEVAEETIKLCRTFEKA